MRGLVTALETRVPGSAGHCRRVGAISGLVAARLGVDPCEVARIERAARVHDVGKIIVSPEILEKPGALSRCEFEEIQRHAVFGARLVASLEDPDLTAIVRHHHERRAHLPPALPRAAHPGGRDPGAERRGRPHARPRGGHRLHLLTRRGRGASSLPFPTPLRRLLAALLVLVAFAGGAYLLSQGTTTPASAASTASASRVAPKGFFGIVPQTTLTEKDVKYMKAGGIETIRWPMLWSAMQPTRKGEYNWAAFDPVVEAAALQGLTVLPFVVATPSWLSKKYTTLPIKTATMRKAWTKFLTAAVKRYGPGGEFWKLHAPATIRAETEKETKGPVYEIPGAHLTPIAKPLPINMWQVWNEANFFYFAYPVSPHDYARLLKLSAPVIKRANPRAKVMLTGLFGQPTAGAKRGMPAAEFLEQLYQVAGIKNDFDAVALHPYAIDSEQLEELVEEFHQVTVANSDRIPLYITEMGWGSQNDFHINAFEHGVLGQVEELKSAYTYLLENRTKLDLKSVYWFSWKDLPESCSFCDSVGFFKSGAGFRAKPAWRAFVQITHGRTHP